MKMTKIEFWRKVKEKCEDQDSNGGVCWGSPCEICPYNLNTDCTSCGLGGNRFSKKEMLELAEAYIKRHEHKCKKKNHITDASKKVEEPKPVKTVGIDNSDITLAKPTVKENLSVPCEHLINGDSCGNPFDHCDKDCPANSEYPDPIRIDIPNVFYCPTPDGILRFKRSQIILKDTNNEDCLLKYLDEYPCYRTPEEALMVAKKLWGIK